MDNEKSLGNLNEGEWCRVASLPRGCELRRRLQDLGFIEGTLVRCRQKSMFGDPIAYFVRGAIIALRLEDACRIGVFPVETR